ncbi:MAG: DNA/RNA non-specific endonuclease [Oscillospiraceae bacterium]|jgi:DNA-entry nuclease|nr:DNA/RNA non-specific endonuclease [Oscillospiraceae bacterium]
MTKTIRTLFPLLLAVSLILSACSAEQHSCSSDSIPEYSGSPYVTVNDNQPDFSDADLTTTSYESYSELDGLGRCGAACACICTDTMPTEKRGSIGQIKPSGWHTVKYDGVDGKYLYNRCHLIGYQLTAENANEKNLITGTRYLNVDGMLPFENMVTDYIKETGNHVVYRVTPVFKDSNLVASGVVMEAESVEDQGDGICFHVFCYNNQPGITIDYATGDSALSGSGPSSAAKSAVSQAVAADSSTESSVEQTYILNTSTHKFHLPSCSSVDDIKHSNKKTFTGTRDDLLAQGYEPCGQCKP